MALKIQKIDDQANHQAFLFRIIFGDQQRRLLPSLNWDLFYMRG